MNTAPSFFRTLASRFRTILLIASAVLPTPLFAQREVQFPPAEGKPPPPAKAPPKTQTGGEETDVIPDPGPTMRKTQERTPPPPTTLTVMLPQPLVAVGASKLHAEPHSTVLLVAQVIVSGAVRVRRPEALVADWPSGDRKSTRLNSSHRT